MEASKKISEIGERKLVINLKNLFEKNRNANLKKILIHKNLSTQNFRKIWSEWWEDELPPKLEVDVIPIFEDDKGQILIAAVEVKFFKGKEKSFCEGIQQALSFGLLGFDSLAVWHIFSEEMENKSIEGSVRAATEIIENFNLPIVYLATKLIKEDKFEFFAPWPFYSSMIFNADYVLSSLRECCIKKRNPLIYRKEIERRRNMLKVELKIPR